MLELILKYFSTPTSPTIKPKEAVKSAALFLLRVLITAFHFIGSSLNWAMDISDIGRFISFKIYFTEITF